MGRLTKAEQDTIVGELTTDMGSLSDEESDACTTSSTPRISWKWTRGSACSQTTRSGTSTRTPTTEPQMWDCRSSNCAI
ncbi:hypothetical protein EV643_1542 [Kribbella sp. VKM Ac-2527]|uniref:Uncharacterized protein n=1 Tax=Kribbella caucasensis TaxID=2512215 RepID=A0A4R6IY21_9ACTN|nr:hypothetical protein EV643_1542 [Kribbella sp. VKM Ac-2527]